MPNTVILGHKPQLREKAAVAHPDKTVHPGRNMFQVRHLGAGGVV